MAALLIIGRHLGANVTGILVILAINFAVGLIWGGISWQAHLGGIIAGAAVAFVYTRTRRREQRVWQIVGLSAVVLVLIAAVLIVPPMVLLS
jgi:membrane associated rhomboid family serine protease